MKIKLVFILLGIGVINYAQKVGVNTATPTENLDINGTLRVRSLPLDSQTNAFYTTGVDTASETQNQTFRINNPVVANNFGVLGQTDKAILVPKVSTSDLAATSDTSPYMMVSKRFTVIDNVGGVDGRYSPTRVLAQREEFDTGMTIANWQAFMSNAMWNFTTASTGAQFLVDKSYNYRLKAGADGKWKIIGDIPNIKETGFVDVLFIKSSVVAAEPRTN